MGRKQLTSNSDQKMNEHTLRAGTKVEQHE
jgi:hypothetical protein